VGKLVSDYKTITRNCRKIEKISRKDHGQIVKRPRKDPGKTGENSLKVEGKDLEKIDKSLRRD
jgi:hypothetical protein